VAKEREPKPLGDLVPLLVSGRGWGERLAIGRVKEAWETIVGPAVAARSEPIRLARGTLTVRADGNAWAAELTLLAASLAAQVNAFLGGDRVVREVRIAAGSLPDSGKGIRPRPSSEKRVD
jgi:predicted nucleic acid-binding Zn ribbon protein